MDQIVVPLGRWLFRYRIAVQAVVVSIVSYSTALLTTYVKSTDPSADGWTIIVLGAFGVVLVMTFVSMLVDKTIRQSEKLTEREHNIHRTGYMTLNREMTNYIQIVRELSEATPADKFQIPVRLMMKAVSELYETVEAEYGTSTSLEEHIEFEITFMTKSLKDGQITIAAWASRDGRAPKSLAKRDQDPSLYHDTETAKLYADINRSVRVIEKTDGPDYRELYPGQKKRIRSSIIFPVLDDKFELLGTLVVHCDKDRFFLPGRIKSWKELLEPYTKRLVLARIGAQKLAEQYQRYREF